jgi:prepilin-type N-terminal cleavage/methylation domain-containing protein/prepilin-type processing-associated H-X9-DG protein
MKTRRQREGFTLVELLVVITIIGMLMALLLPAIQAAREAARRATCMNNQRNLGFAMLNYQAAKGVFPGFLNEIGTLNKGTPSAAPYFGSWIVPILPYLERQDVYELWTKLTPSGQQQHLIADASGKPQGFVNIPLLICPSNPTAASPGQAPNAYRVNAGRAGSSSRVVAAASVDDTISCGVFDIVSPYLTTGGAIKNTAMSIDGIRDGTVNTLMLSENTRAGDFWTAGAAGLDMANLFKSDAPYDGRTDTFDKCEAALGFRIPKSTTSPEGLEFPMNVNVDGRTSGEPRGASPGSYHSGLVIVTFCDGHVRPLDQRIDPNTYLHMITPNGKKAQEWAYNHPSGRLPYFSEMTGVLDEAN